MQQQENFSRGYVSRLMMPLLTSLIKTTSGYIQKQTVAAKMRQSTRLLISSVKCESVSFQSRSLSCFSSSSRIIVMFQNVPRRVVENQEDDIYQNAHCNIKTAEYHFNTSSTTLRVQNHAHVRTYFPAIQGAQKRGKC